MSIGEALNFPFKNNNLLKILPIALSYGIVMFLLNYGTITENFLILGIAGIAVLIFSLVIAGYYISVARRLQRGNDNLPDVDIGNDMKQGCATSIATMIYVIPLIILMTFIIMAGAMFGMLFVVIGFLICIPLTFVFSAALMIALMRYADEEQSAALYAFGENFNLAKSNIDVYFGLLGRLIILGIIIFVVSFVLGIITGTLFPNQNSPYFQPTTGYWLALAFAQVITYAVSLIFALSQYHLIAHYGIQLGIGSLAKRKPVKDKYAF